MNKKVTILIFALFAALATPLIGRGRGGGHSSGAGHVRSSDGRSRGDSHGNVRHQADGIKNKGRKTHGRHVSKDGVI